MNIEHEIGDPVRRSSLLVRCFVILSQLHPVDREYWYDHEVLGITHVDLAGRDGVSKARSWTRIDKAKKKIRVLREIAA